MKRKRSVILKVDAGFDKSKTEYSEAAPRPLPVSSHNGEYTVAFNQYNVVYSNNLQGNLSSPWRAGATSIGCYKDGNFVGVICFYNTAERMGGGYVDANGVVVIEYPIEKFEDVMRILRTFTNLSLLFVERDLQGNPLAHRVGAIMTFQKKPIGG